MKMGKIHPPHHHLVLCGLKREMNLLVQEILQLNPQWGPSDIFVIAKIKAEALKKLQQDPNLQGVHFIIDSPFNEQALHSVQVERAQKVMVLSDWSDKGASVKETDARAILTAMAVRKISPQTCLVVELLDPSFSAYLKTAHVDEVIYSREYSRILLANSVSSSGTAHVIYDLLSVSKDYHITTWEIPSEFHWRPFSELALYFNNLAEPRTICLGLLENAGNINNLRRKVISDAQKFPDISGSLANLRGLKEFESNTPRINPSEDYKIIPNSMAIVLTYRDLRKRKDEAA